MIVNVRIQAYPFGENWVVRVGWEDATALDMWSWNGLTTTIQTPDTSSLAWVLDRIAEAVWEISRQEAEKAAKRERPSRDSG